MEWFYLYVYKLVAAKSLFWVVLLSEHFMSVGEKPRAIEM